MHYFFPETRHYLKWNIEPHIILPKDFCPVKEKLFPGDEINNAGKAEKSPYREKRNIPGVLVLTGKTYGTTGKGKSARKGISSTGALEAPETEKTRSGDWGRRLRGQPGGSGDRSARALRGSRFWPSDPASAATDDGAAETRRHAHPGYQLPGDRKVRQPPPTES